MGGRTWRTVCIRRINLGRPAMIEPRPRQLGAQAERLSLPRTLPPSTPAPMPYAAGAGCAPRIAEAASARAAPHQPATPHAAARRRSSAPRPTGTRACPPPPCCSELPAPEPSEVSTEHPRTSKPTLCRMLQLSAAGNKAVAVAGLLSPSLSLLSPSSPSACRSDRSR
jgi:hypothetical protein